MPLDGSEFKFEIDETTKLLIAARERIERGWCQNKMRLGGDVCMVGAMTDSGAGSLAWRQLRSAVGASLDTMIVDWNDTPGRTKEEVLAAFDRAISASLSGSAYP